VQLLENIDLNSMVGCGTRAHLTGAPPDLSGRAVALAKADGAEQKSTTSDNREDFSFSLLTPGRSRGRASKTDFEFLMLASSG
jgi:hypothetical protein